MTDIISDPSKFSPINEPILKFSIKIEDKINNFLRKIKNLNLIPEELYKLLFVTGSGPGILYGLPKIHKPDFSTKFQFRPIFAAYNTPSFKIAKYLVSILSNLTFNSYSAKDSFQWGTPFADEIRSFPNADSYFMASFDVESLFTNVPIHETIDICISKLFPSKDSSVIGLTSSLFRRLLELATLNSFFLFNRKLFRQTEGLGMGLPLGPTMVNIFMCFHEENWLDNCPAQFKPVLYRRYVDDTFLLFKSESHTTQFLNYLNTKHPNIKFTMEKESQNNISFLDINIHKALNFQTSIHRKPTFTGLGLSFFSFCPKFFKINAIKTLIYRAYHLCSDYTSLNSEFNFLHIFFSQNGFPSHLVHKNINHFLSKIYNSNPINLSSTSTSDKTLFISLPYFGPQYKDKLPKDVQSSIIYKFRCPQSCGSEYVGLTSRAFFTRVSEHLGHKSDYLEVIPYQYETVLQAGTGE
ncbi:hypothetical protein GQR58_005637 [Nymphon striatum]|nr:hypothetical protein GQR58_005637 [Nymphon striatum]